MVLLTTRHDVASRRLSHSCGGQPLVGVDGPQKSPHPPDHRADPEASVSGGRDEHQPDSCRDDEIDPGPEVDPQGDPAEQKPEDEGQPGFLPVGQGRERECIIQAILSTNLVSFLYEPCATYAPYACSARRLMARRLMARSSIRARTALPALIISHQ